MYHAYADNFRRRDSTTAHDFAQTSLGLSSAFEDLARAQIGDGESRAMQFVKGAMGATGEWAGAGCDGLVRRAAEIFDIPSPPLSAAQGAADEWTREIYAREAMDCIIQKHHMHTTSGARRQCIGEWVRTFAGAIVDVHGALQELAHEAQVPFTASRDEVYAICSWIKCQGTVTEPCNSNFDIMSMASGQTRPGRKNHLRMKIMDPDGNIITDGRGRHTECKAVINGEKCTNRHRVGGGKLFECSNCKSVLYCCKEHARIDWKYHKKQCTPPDGFVPRKRLLKEMKKHIGLV